MSAFVRCRSGGREQQQNPFDVNHFWLLFFNQILFDRKNAWPVNHTIGFPSKIVFSMVMARGGVIVDAGYL